MKGRIHNFFKSEMELFKISFSFSKKDFLSLLYIVLSFVSIFLIIFLFMFLEYSMIVNKLMNLDLASAVQGFGTGMVMKAFSEFYTYSIFFIVLSFALAILSGSFFRMMIFSNFLNEKFKKKLYWKYVLGYLIPLAIFWVIITFYFSRLGLFNNSFLFIRKHIRFLFIVFVITSHYLNYYTLNTLKGKKIMPALVNAIWDSVNIKNFLIPYFLFCLFTSVAGLLSNFIPQLSIISFLLVIFFYFWLKKYLVVHHETSK
ncbi:hypothetical protein KY321_00380 [Candidatus Woesearchaeota archaeon]|nr:hypothetical protein [Candidatus Woesearchaeota archaeon]